MEIVSDRGGGETGGSVLGVLGFIDDTGLPLVGIEVKVGKRVNGLGVGFVVGLAVGAVVGKYSGTLLPQNCRIRVKDLRPSNCGGAERSRSLEISQVALRLF